jgi:hypothetical protein
MKIKILDGVDGERVAKISFPRSKEEEIVKKLRKVFEVEQKVCGW